MIDSGEIDALYTARAPSTFCGDSGQVKRLFEDYQSVERDYYKKTGIFPIMHVVAIRRDVYEKHRWVAQSLCKAFTLAQRDTYEDLHEMGALKAMLPWLVQHVEDTEKLMGRDFWSYGLEPNIHVLQTFLRYSFEQGLAKRLLAPAELFAPESLESFKI
jgi:4,5-dihydroxyphthalate decarboxylase